MEPIIVKVSDAARQNHKLNKLIGNVPLNSFVDLVSIANLEANPRLAKISRVTKDIEESLEKEPELFPFMSKGILVAAAEIEELERNRFRLKFSDPELEGILDGGHNTFAIGRHALKLVLTKVLDEDQATDILSKIKTWEDLKTAWKDYFPQVQANKSALPDILIPIEIIYPSDDAEAAQLFLEKVLLINAARNNNAELTTETKANKKGYYSEIRDNLDPVLVDSVEWKTNDGGRIKVRDLVALALIPLSKLPHKSLDQVRKNPSVLFSSKGQCLDIYNNLMEEKNVVAELKGGIVEIVDPDIKSALSLVKDFPRIFDLIYERMPEAYNGAGGKFGKIDGVMGSSNGNPKYKTRYYKSPVSYRYGEGYMYPLVYGMTALLKKDGADLKWITDPDMFIKKHLTNIMKSYYSMITGQNWDPAKVGKSNGAYNLAHDLVLAAYRDDLLKEHGLA